MTSDDLEAVITEATNAALAVMTAKLGQGWANHFNPKDHGDGFSAKVLEAPRHEQNLRGAFLSIHEQLTDLTYELSNELDEAERARWSRYSRNRPDALSARDLL